MKKRVVFSYRDRVLDLLCIEYYHGLTDVEIKDLSIRCLSRTNVEFVEFRVDISYDQK